jgi:hypothetical protein
MTTCIHSFIHLAHVEGDNEPERWGCDAAFMLWVTLRIQYIDWVVVAVSKYWTEIIEAGPRAVACALQP